MHGKEQKQQELLDMVKKYPGLPARQYWLKLGLSESRKMALQDRLFALRGLGKVWCEEVRVDGHLKERRWYPFTDVKEK